MNSPDEKYKLARDVRDMDLFGPRSLAKHKPGFEPASETRLASTSFVPPDFKFEVIQLPDGRLETRPFVTNGMTANPRDSARFAENVTIELVHRFQAQYKCGCSSIAHLTPEGELSVLLRTTEPYITKLEAEPPKKEIGKDFIEVTVSSVAWTPEHKHYKPIRRIN